MRPRALAFIPALAVLFLLGCQRAPEQELTLYRKSANLMYTTVTITVSATGDYKAAGGQGERYSENQSRASDAFHLTWYPSNV